MDLYKKILEETARGRNYLASGLTGSSRAYFVNGLAGQAGGQDLLCLCATEEKALDLYRDLMVFAGPEAVRLYPARDFVFLKESAYSPHSNRIKVLNELNREGRPPFIMVSTPLALMYRLLPPAELRRRCFRLSPGQEIERDELLRRLAENRYQRVDTVTAPGEFAVRGGIVDIFTALEPYPVRLEYFGSEIDSLRRFDPETQRSTAPVEGLEISPAEELEDYGDYESDGIEGEAGSGKKAASSSGRSREAARGCLWDYIPEALVFADEPRDIARNLEKNLARYQQFARDASREGKTVRQLQLLKARELEEWLKSRPVLYHAFFPGSLDGLSAAGMEHIHSQEMESFYLRYDSFAGRAREWQARGLNIEIRLENPAIRDKIKKNLKAAGVRGVKYRSGLLDKGFISQTLGLALVAETDLIGKKRAPVPGRARGQALPDAGAMLDSLASGDYVVHENYGIACYHGLQRLTREGASKEYLLLQFAGADRLYLPVDRLELLHRYSGAGDREPRLSRLGGADWQKTRKKVSESIQEMAQELMELYAERDGMRGFAFESDSPWQRQFEQDFPYTETPDQMKAILDTKADMERDRPMDRLICGDVGYGKTEVALRAAFKAVMNSRQVALLVPTTVLAEQHYETFVQRFKSFPATVEVLSRFKNAREQKRILKDLENGVTDIIIGTHRLLSADVKTARLGLLIIDEEHRFGVAQKEKIKFLKRNVDVLSLSATPIPRSLHFALSGLRDLSVIETPPPERYPVTTYVLEFDPEIVRQAISTELERGGQVFYVHNRISDIGQVRERLQQLVPEASITMGHGRMSEDELERNLVDFVHGRYDILLCTTIIESGLDMPNVNTIIIEMADKLGLAQLYQLRGRVGRSDRLAYAYLTYHPERVVSEEAQKRLNAIREFNELGAGLKIAMRDLEIRGAGNILGSEQHGYMHAVGFDLYVRMLEQESARIKGQPPVEDGGPHMDIDMDFYVPDSYIADPGQKMKLYRRLLLARELDAINDLEAEVLDRYGPLPDSLNNFFRVSRLRVLARSKQIKGILRSGKKVTIQVGHPLPPPLMKLLEQRGFKRQDSDAISISLEDRSLDRLEQLIEAL